MNPSIEFREVLRRFGDLEVLRGLSFQVAPGEVFALLGRNGAGKTTALRILLGFLRPMQGTARVLGVDSRGLKARDRGRIGYVGEGHRFFPLMRVKEVLAFEAGTRPRFHRAYAEKAIAQCGLPPGSPVRRLSRGQRAQLALILAAAGDPEVLILDDPARGLDAVMRRAFLDAMIDILSDRRCAVLFSSHILTDVERIADRAGILHGGRLIVDATLDDLKRRVQKRRWTGPAAGGNPPRVEGLLCAKAVRDGFELTLLDMTPDREAALAAAGGRLSEPVVPTLEELFIDLTAGGTPGLLPPYEESPS